MVGGLAEVLVGTRGSHSKQSQIFEAGEVGGRQEAEEGHWPVLLIFEAGLAGLEFSM